MFELGGWGSISAGFVCCSGAGWRRDDGGVMVVVPAAVVLSLMMVTVATAAVGPFSWPLAVGRRLVL